MNVELTCAIVAVSAVYTKIQGLSSVVLPNLLSLNPNNFFIISNLKQAKNFETNQQLKQLAELLLVVLRRILYDKECDYFIYFTECLKQVLETRSLGTQRVREVGRNLHLVSAVEVLEQKASLKEEVALVNN